ncbi:MAG: hypothetical protein N2Z84_05765 [Atribacterota bacterium]|nr:hypothetical protein [Atribacterota bacterium]
MRLDSFILVLVFVAVGMAFLTLKVVSFWRARRLRKIFSHAHNVEKQASHLLEKRGYQVLGEQVEKDAFMVVDGRMVPYRVRVDYLLRKGNKTYVAEVKTGNQAVSFLQSHTRRQLLEYYLVYRPQAVLLVDGEAGKIEEVVFPNRKSGLRIWGWGVIFFFLGLVVGQWVSLL